MAWRRAAAGGAAGTQRVLEEFAAELEDAAARGDEWAAGRLPSALSWVSMAAGCGAEVSGLFAEFARCDREVWERRRGVA